MSNIEYDVHPRTIADLKRLAQLCLERCDDKLWKRDWSSGGCYLHLEVSEFIEALRGKKGKPEHEAGDVLFVLLSMMAEQGVDLEETIQYLKELT